MGLLRTSNPFTDRGECQLAFRSRGNQPFAGGIAIDLRSLRDYNIHPEKDSTSVKAGAPGGDFYTKLDTIGLAIAGGRSS